MGLLRLTPENAALVDKTCELSWLVEILLNVYPALLKLQKARAALASQDKTRAQADLLAAQLELLRLATDVPVALAGLTWLPDGFHSGAVGVAGLVSSLVGLWEVWPAAPAK